MPARTRAGGKQPRQRASLSRDKIIKQAIRIADSRSLAELNMRSLAKELGCGVMSLYNHVSSIDDLNGAMVNAIVGKFSLPVDTSDWKLALRASAISAHEVLLDHPWAVSVWSKAGMANSSVDLHTFFEFLLRVMREAGLSEAQACRGFHALTMHIVGFTQQQLELPFKNRKQFESAATVYVTELGEESFPYVVEHVKHHLEGEKGINHFEFLLDLILDNLQK